MSNVTQNIHDCWPHAMDVTKDRKTNSNIKSSFMHYLLHIVIFFIVCKCLLMLLMLLLLKCSNKSLTTSHLGQDNVYRVLPRYEDGKCNVHRRQIKNIFFY